MSLQVGADLERRVRRAAEVGEAATPADSFPLDVLWRDYAAASPGEQFAAQALFRDLAADSDPRVRSLAVFFFWQLPREVGGPVLFDIGERHGALFDAQDVWFSGLTLRGQLLAAIGERRARGDDARVRKLFLALGPGAGPLPGSVGSILAEVGVDLWAHFVAGMAERDALDVVRDGAFVFAARRELDAARQVPLMPALRLAFEEGVRQFG